MEYENKKNVKKEKKNYEKKRAKKIWSHEIDSESQQKNASQQYCLIIGSATARKRSA